jgi:hypothetical protein
MHAVELIASAIKNDPECPEIHFEQKEGLCCATGRTGPTVPRSELFGKSFTNGDALAFPLSDRVSIAAYIALKFKWERMGSWMCDGETFLRLDRIGVRNVVLADEMPEKWAGYATISYKKHGALRAPVNTGRQRFWLFETRLVDCTRMEDVWEWWTILNLALHGGFGRRIIETLDCPTHVMKKCGLEKWMRFEKWARFRYHSALYTFLCYLLPSMEELKNEKSS